jgi:uncharacterized protein (TIGR00645 family)
MEKVLERVIFASRWIQAPLYLGLVVALLVLTVKFLVELVHLVPGMVTLSESEVVLGVLTLVDLVLVANLVLMVVFAGYENFVSKIDTAGHPDRPEWMGKVDVSGLKLRLIASIVAISSIQLLKAFMHSAELADRDLAWLVGIHITFVVSGVLLALMDRLAEPGH